MVTEIDCVKTPTRYSASALAEFKVLIEQKLKIERDELAYTMNLMGDTNENGERPTANDGAGSQEKEQLSILAGRQKKFIEQLEAALVRIENKTYGICRESGKLIAKERLLAVPHTTLSMEAKLRGN